MCKHLTILAKASATRYVAQCEHGTVHLIWDNLSLRLPPSGFIKLAEQIYTQTDGLLGQDQKTGFGLRMRGIELKVYPQALSVLRSLMGLAMLQMDRPTDAPASSTEPDNRRRGFSPDTPTYSVN